MVQRMTERPQRRVHRDSSKLQIPEPNYRNSPNDGWSFFPPPAAVVATSDDAKEMMDETVRHVVAGTCGGVASIVVCHPLDTLRTRMQTGSGSLWQCGKELLRKEGIQGFYRGFWWPAVAQGLYKAIMFGVYGTAKRWTNETPVELALCGGLAGGANAFVLTPIELVRNRQQVGSNDSGLKIWRDVYRSRGLLGLYTGFGATLLRDVPGVAAYYLTFELFRDKNIVVAGALGGAAFWTLALPFDHIKSNLQVYSSSWRRPSNILHLYVGYGSALLRGIPGAAVVFSVYGVVFTHLSSFSSSSSSPS